MEEPTTSSLNPNQDSDTGLRVVDRSIRSGQADQKQFATTISTIAIKAGENARLTLAVLKISDFVQIRVDEMIPSFLDIGGNHATAVQLKEQHKIVLQKLAAKENEVKQMFARADRLVTEKQSEGSGAIFELMINSLSSAWHDLNGQLSVRSAALDSAVKFFESFERHCKILNQLNEILNSCLSGRHLSDIDRIIESCNECRRHLLDVSVDLMTFGQQTIERLRQIGSFVDDLETSKDVLKICSRIEDRMIQCNEARRVVDQKCDQIRLDLDWFKQLSGIDSDLKSIDNWLNQKKELFYNEFLGDNEAESTALYNEYEKVLGEAKELYELTNKLLSLLNRFLNGAKRDEVSSLYKKCLTYRDALSRSIATLESRRHDLNLASKFFQEAIKALNELTNVQERLRSMSLSRHRQIMIHQHAELADLVHKCVQPALAQGRSLLQRVTSGSLGLQGVQRVLLELEKKVAEIDELCTAHKADATMRSEKFIELESNVDKLKSWLENVGEAFLFAENDLGTSERMADEFASKHNAILTSIKEKEGNEMKTYMNMVSLALNTVDFNESDKNLISTKCSDLTQRFHKLRRIIQARIRLAEHYSRFHRLSSQLSSDIDVIEALIKTTEEFVNDSSRTKFEEAWLMLVEDFRQLRSEADRYLTHTTQPLDDSILDVKSSRDWLENRLAYLTTRMIGLERLRAEFGAKMQKLAEFSEQWRQLTEECKQIINEVSDLQSEANSVFERFESLNPATLAHSQRQFLQEFRQKTENVTHGLESCLHTAEILGVRGETHGQRQSLIDELLRTHRHVQTTFGQLEVLLSMTVTFFRNLQQVDEWIERVEQTYSQEQVQQQVEKDADRLYQEHRAACQTVDEFLRFAQSESEQIIRRAKQPDVQSSIREECEKTTRLVENRSKRWKTVRQNQSSYVDQFLTALNLEYRITQMSDTIEKMSEEIRKVSKDATVSSAARHIGQCDLEQIIQKTSDTEIQVESVIRESESAKELISPLRITELIERIKRRWIEYKDELLEVEQKLEESKTYWNLIEKIEYWVEEVTEYIIEIGKKMADLEKAEDVRIVRHYVDEFLREKEEERRKYTMELERVSRILYGEQVDNKLSKYTKKFKEIVDSMHVVQGELKKLEATFEQVERRITQNMAPVFIKPLKDMLVPLHSTNVKLECIVIGHPKPRVTWLFNGNPLEVQPNLDFHVAHVDDAHWLTIPVVSSAHVGTYTALAENEVGRTASSAVFRLAEQASSSRGAYEESISEEHTSFMSMSYSEGGTDFERPVYFVQELVDTIVEEGSEAQLACRLQGEPIEIAWRKDGQIMESGEDFVQSYSPSSGVCRLVITEVCVEDQGIISCQAIGRTQQATTSCYMTVVEEHERKLLEKDTGYAPIFVKKLENLQLEGPKPFDLHVSVDAVPAANFVWKFDGQQLKASDSRFAIKTAFNSSTLSALQPIFGQYSVIARNAYGKCSSLVQVELQEGEISNS